MEKETIKPENIISILATDCGSTTTKAILIEKQGDEYRLVTRGEAPTTVEAPFEDVTKGVLNAVKEVEELRGRILLDENKIISPQKDNTGVDIYISTSSAGGGLQMLVAGVVKAMSAESAERAALGAGAIVMDVLASNDGRMPHEKIARIRHLRPDMILLSGGVDGGTISHVVEMAELLRAANPKPRLGANYRLPVIYAGNKNVIPEVEKNLKDVTDLFIVSNLRPVLERENLGPARDKIHELFMEHVMAQAPGYKKLMEMTHAPIMPTPGAVGTIIQVIARNENISVVGVDIGGATTDIFSVFKDPYSGEPVFNRTVSANLGMSYSISNVLAEAKLENILRWVPFEIDETDLRNRIGNKMIRPTTIPQSLDELKIEQAIAREALRLSFIQHKSFAVGLKGVQKERTISDTFDQSSTGETLVNMMDLDLLVGSGGVLSHAPRRHQSARMMIDAFLPEGITQLAVDSIFMMPQLGVLSSVHEKAATEVFVKDCLLHLGTCIAPVGTIKPGKEMVTVKLELPEGKTYHETIPFGEMVLIEAPYVPINAEITPVRGIDVGNGPGNALNTTIYGGLVGIIIDTRGRNPFVLPTNHDMRIKKLQAWSQAVKEFEN
ncbi:MAG: glutamate mutase L [Candidatus Marinimicrobia bacterium]|nr:glutamate mutase L [Candidatus Neomarinimicrobiota bacterium]MDD5582758.1 glutamate mutase L [Candidatus Neomarinimicrobiota bacterium]